MAAVYDYLMQVWLRFTMRQASPDIEQELLEYLQDEFQVNEIKIVEDDDRADDEVEVSLAMQLSFDESQMDGEEPTAEAVAEFDQELRSHLSAKYELDHLDVMDDAPGSYLINEWDDSEA